MASKDKDAVVKAASTDDLSIVFDTTSSANHEIDRNKPIRTSFKHLFSFTRWNHTAPLTAALASSAGFAAIKSIYPIFLGKIFNIVSDFGAGRRSGSETLGEISHWSLILIGLGLVNCVLGSAFLSLWVIFGELQAKSVRQEIFKSLLSKNIAWFDSLDQGISSLLVRIQTQTRELQVASSQVFGLLVTDGIVSIVSLAIAFYYSWKLTLVLLATLPISLMLLSFATRRLDPALQAQKRDLETASKFATSSIKAIEIVKIFNGFDREIRQYHEAIMLAGRQYLVQAQCNCFQMGYVAFWVVGMFVAGFWYGSVLVNQGLSPGHVMTTFFSVLSAFQGIEGLLPQWLVLSKGMFAGAFLSSLLTASDDAAAEKNDRQLRPDSCIGNVDLLDVTFAYPSNPEKTVLNKSSFFFPAGQLTFIVGRSGSGKSTIGNLVSQFYDPSSGLICLDGYPLATLDGDWVRSNIALIQQLSVVFDDSVFNNVAVGHHDPEAVTREAVSTACEFALLQSTLSGLPEGLNTRIGSSGQKLSGGQMQRIALARARLRDPAVLILDEVTSSLDQVNRSLIIDAIRMWRQDKTTIIITHDISQIEDDEYVYVMQDASLVQQGFRRKLASIKTGPFASLACQPSLSTPRKMHMADSTANMELEKTWESSDAEKVSAEDEDFRRNSSSTSISECFEPSSKFTMSDSAYRSSSESDYTLAYSHDSVYDMDDPSYLFGKADRRSNISSLRVASNREQSPTVGEDVAAEKPVVANPGTLTSILKTVWPTLTPKDRALFVGGIIMCLISSAAKPIFSYCLSLLLAVLFLPENRTAAAKQKAIYLVITAVIDGTSTGIGHYMLERAGQSWVNALRLEALKRILRQPKSWFDADGNSASRINECLERNSEETRNLVGRFIPVVISVIGMTAISMIWAFVTSWKLTLVALSTLPLVLGIVKGYTIISSKWEAKCNQGASDASAVFSETFVNIRVVRALMLEKYFGAKHDKLASHAFGLGLRRAGYTCGPFGVYQSMNYPMTALVFYYATVLLNKNDGTTVAKILQVINLLLFSIGTSTALLGSIPQMTMAKVTATQLLAYAAMPMESTESQGGIEISTPLPVKVRNLQFAYSQSSPRVLHDVSFTIRQGTCTGIVGSSGSGKSTIISLLMGLYRPSDATRSLTFAGVPLSKLDMQHLRSTMAYVSQRPHLFPATVMDNIVYGLAEDSCFRDSLNVQAATKAAGIHDFIVSLPQGYTTLIGDGGIALSGGQEQRLSIARALVRHPRLLILDEPTSALDAESTSMIRETICSLTERARQKESGMAIVMVTHTPEMMKICDSIVMIDGGVKVEEGSFDELMEAKGPFGHLISRGEWHGGD
ncbi:P-loop containing nucleoside triphosphate hydrolase protein [Trichoderma austrokoningii]